MKFYITIIGLLVAIAGHSQLVTGKVVDSKQDPISDVYIKNLRSTGHTHTSVLGIFAVEKTQAGDTLSISAIGFKNKNHIVQSSDTSQEIQILLEDQVFQLDELLIEQGLDATKAITTINLQTDPVNSAQEILQNVPGLFIGQHAGGGKAEQLFLRGFDIDHGTDVAISVDGMPVNMVSHAHGQGYADLHFVIPETIQFIDFNKGAYDVTKGNFATAGYVDFQTKERLEESSVTATVADFNTTRSVGLIDILNHKKGQSAYIASEYLASDGPFESEQHFDRINLMGKYTTYLPNNNKLSASVSHFTSTWDASGQIPERAVASGEISRFGAIDDTEGGETSRTNLIMSYVKSVGTNKLITNNVFYTNYAFKLYSNFSFFLNDPINGDQIKQKETRNIFGISRILEQELNMDTRVKTGLGLRNDRVPDSELSRSANRKTTLEHLQLGAINETNIYGFANIDYIKDRWKLNAGARVDYFKFNYNDQLTSTYETQSENAFKISPKFSVFYNANSLLQMFLKAGMGFHSNDTRLMAQQSEAVLPTSYNTDLGMLWKPASRLLFNTDLWYLFLEDELVYVGDEGIVESGGATQRLGADFGIRFQAKDWLFFNTDINYAHARSADSPTGENYVPLAPNLTITGGIKLVDIKSFSGGIQTRFLNDRPANEDNSIVASGYVVTDVNLNYQWKNTIIGITSNNLFNTIWNETQFATLSRLKNEANAVEEIHFTPGTPFQLKGTITYTF